MLHRVVEWLGEPNCAQPSIFPPGYMQDAQPDPLPGFTVAQPPAAPAPVAPVTPVATKSSRWWVAPLLIGGTAGLIFWRTLALRGGSS